MILLVSIQTFQLAVTYIFWWILQKHGKGKGGFHHKIHILKPMDLLFGEGGTKVCHDNMLSLLSKVA